MNRIYTFYTDTHKHMYDEYFMKSVPDSFRVRTLHMPQECESGNFHAEGWMKTMMRKVDYVVDSINEVIYDGTEWFVHADCDIQFFGDFHDDIESELDGFDMVNMDDNMLCAGFFACRANSKTLNLWKSVRDNLSKYPNDQIAMNNILPTSGVRYNKLPRFKYFNYMHTIGHDSVWDGQADINISRSNLDSILVHHANYTIGVENKIKMMEHVRDGKNIQTQ